MCPRWESNRVEQNDYLHMCYIASKDLSGLVNVYRLVGVFASYVWPVIDLTYHLLFVVKLKHKKSVCC